MAKEPQDMKFLKQERETYLDSFAADKTVIFPELDHSKIKRELKISVSLIMGLQLGKVILNSELCLYPHMCCHILPQPPLVKVPSVMELVVNEFMFIILHLSHHYLLLVWDQCQIVSISSFSCPTHLPPYLSPHQCLHM